VAFDADLEDVRVAVDELRILRTRPCSSANDRPGELEVDDVVEDDAIADRFTSCPGQPRAPRPRRRARAMAEVFGLRRPSVS